VRPLQAVGRAVCFWLRSRRPPVCHPSSCPRTPSPPDRTCWARWAPTKRRPPPRRPPSGTRGTRGLCWSRTTTKYCGAQLKIKLWIFQILFSQIQSLAPFSMESMMLLIFGADSNAASCMPNDWQKDFALFLIIWCENKYALNCTKKRLNLSPRHWCNSKCRTLPSPLLIAQFFLLMLK